MVAFFVQHGGTIPANVVKGVMRNKVGNYCEIGPMVQEEMSFEKKHNFSFGGKNWRLSI